MRAEDARGTPTQSHISPSILENENDPKLITDRPYGRQYRRYKARERPTSGAATAFLMPASSELVALGAQPQALLGEGWLKSTWGFLKLTDFR